MAAVAKVSGEGDTVGGSGGTGGDGDGFSDVDNWLGSSSLPTQRAALPEQDHSPPLCRWSLISNGGQRFHFQGKDNLERIVSLSEITLLNMLALMVTEEGYTEVDYMFYVKNEGQGSAGLQVIDNEEVVEEMLDRYAPEKLLNITVIKATEPNPRYFNIGNSSEAQIPIDQVGQSNIISIDEAGVLFTFEKASSEEVYVVPICTPQPGEHIVFLNTQESVTLQKAKGEKKAREYYGPSDDDGFVDFKWCEYKAEHHNIGVQEENEIIDQPRKMRKQREDLMINFEGDTKVEEIFPGVEDSHTEPETTLPQTFKTVGKAGPTTRSHQ
ncbi:hypothetical protein D1007_35610 [Hordeum vulgare]|nr:hypothetical protein D1007_35610 [Hordeum vulgare]